MSGTKPTNPNPKDAVGVDKLPLHLIPFAAKALMALGLLDGAGKYGRANYYEAGASAVVYLDAIERHLDALKAGEDIDPDSGLPHMAHLLASAAIHAHAEATGVLVDDRLPRVRHFRNWVTKLTAHVPRLRAKHKDKNPKHWSIQDTPSDVTITGISPNVTGMGVITAQPPHSQKIELRDAFTGTYVAGPYPYPSASQVRLPEFGAADAEAYVGLAPDTHHRGGTVR